MDGITPIRLEFPLHAQFLIAMAASLSFGIMTSTVLVLILAPPFHCIMDIVFKIGPRSEMISVSQPAIAERAVTV